MLILDVLDEIPDPRRCNAVHDLTDLLFTAFAAMLCGAVNCTEMAIFAETRLELLRQFVPLEAGAPGHDTFSRVFRMLDPAAFAASFQRLMTAFGTQARTDLRGQVAVDGKSLRRPTIPKPPSPRLGATTMTATRCAAASSPPFSQSPGKNNLEDLVAVARVEAWRTIGEKTTHKVRTFALSKRLAPAEVLRAVKGHWQIENNLHW